VTPLSPLDVPAIGSVCYRRVRRNRTPVETKESFEWPLQKAIPANDC
jgi:hypothetical protein